jgi:hypothetical protein
MAILGRITKHWNGKLVERITETSIEAANMPLPKYLVRKLSRESGR